MIAIETRYAGPTNTMPSRIIASTCNGQRVVVTQGELDANVAPYSSHDDDRHKYAATKLANQMDWLSDGSTLVGGSTKAGYTWVFVSPKA